MKWFSDNSLKHLAEAINESTDKKVAELGNAVYAALQEVYANLEELERRSSFLYSEDDETLTLFLAEAGAERGQDETGAD